MHFIVEFRIQKQRHLGYYQALKAANHILAHNLTEAPKQDVDIIFEQNEKICAKRRQAHERKRKFESYDDTTRKSTPKKPRT